MYPNQANQWPQERIELLTKLWADGLSCSRIANQIGHGLSRSAIIGKVHRLGLPGRGSPAAEARRMNKAEGVKKYRGTKRDDNFRFRRKISVGYTQPQRVKAAPEPIVPLEEIFIPLEQRRTLLQLTAETCRWPVGDLETEDFYFCGAVPKDGKPYCGPHCRIAYMPVTQRQKNTFDRALDRIEAAKERHQQFGAAFVAEGVAA